MPQGSVIRSVFFLIYINDLAARVSSMTCLFANSTILYRFITASEDHDTLQADLQKMEEWEEEWDMRFHPSKCSVLTMSRKQTTCGHQYKLHNQVLENVTSMKYLGITLQHSAKFDQNINTVVAKVNRTLGFLRRNLRIRETNIKAQAYKSLVCPILKYSCTVWDPAAQKDINRLDALQCRAARFALNQHQKTASVKQMLQELNWPSLEQRQRRA